MNTTRPRLMTAFVPGTTSHDGYGRTAHRHPALSHRPSTAPGHGTYLDPERQRWPGGGAPL